MLRKLKNLCKYQLPRIQEGFVSLTIEVTKEIMINLFIRIIVVSFILDKPALRLGMRHRAGVCMICI